MHDNGLDIPFIVILHSFYFRPRMVSGKNTRRNIFTIILLCLFSQGYYNKRWKLMLSPESACFETKAHPWETFELCFKLVEWFPSNTNLCVPISRLMPTHNEICNIYDKHISLQPLFQKIYEQEVWVGWKSHVW